MHATTSASRRIFFFPHSRPFQAWPTVSIYLLGCCPCDADHVFFKLASLIRDARGLIFQ